MPGVMAHNYNSRLAKNSSNPGTSTATINASALQSSLAASLNLNATTRSFRRRSRGPTRAAFAAAATSSWSCPSCTLVNQAGTTQCDACAAPYQSNGNTGELPANHGRLNLAQLRGLEEKPKPKLTEKEWTDVEYDALLRGDVTGVCSICHEDLVVTGGSGGEEQVILSCSHTFHAACIASFEKFLRTKERTCPICRHSNYQKKVTSVGTAMRRLECARLMQRFVKGWLVRKEKRNMLRKFYVDGRGQVGRRRDFYAKEIEDLGSRVEKEVEAKEDSIDALFAEFDQSLALSRQVFNVEEGAMEGVQAASVAVPPKRRPSTTMCDWLNVWEQAKARGELDDCPICLGPLNRGGGQVITSCSHIFHKSCLDAFENFNIYEVCLCPVCRSGYDKTDVKNVLQLEHGDSRWLS